MSRIGNAAGRGGADGHRGTVTRPGPTYSAATVAHPRTITWSWTTTAPLLTGAVDALAGIRGSTDGRLAVGLSREPDCLSGG